MQADFLFCLWHRGLIICQCFYSHLVCFQATFLPTVLQVVQARRRVPKASEWMKPTALRNNKGILTHVGVKLKVGSNSSDNIFNSNSIIYFSCIKYILWWFTKFLTWFMILVNLISFQKLYSYFERLSIMNLLQTPIWFEMKNITIKRTNETLYFLLDMLSNAYTFSNTSSKPRPSRSALKTESGDEFNILQGQ